MCMQIKAFMVLMIALLTSNMVAAACSQQTIRGNYAAIGSGLGIDDQGYANAGFFAGRINFDGAGKVKLLNGRVSAEGEHNAISGNGSYKLNPNCVGTSTITLRSSGQVIGKIRLDMIVGGTSQAPQIAVVYTSITHYESGQFVLNKIRI